MGLLNITSTKDALLLSVLLVEILWILFEERVLWLQKFVNYCFSRMLLETKKDLILLI